MEKYSRQLLSEGVVNADDIHVSPDSELFRALNLHYNRNNHIEVRISACYQHYDIYDSKFSTIDLICVYYNRTKTKKFISFFVFLISSGSGALCFCRFRDIA
jgi:hypothetical protein